MRKRLYALFLLCLWVTLLTAVEPLSAQLVCPAEIERALKAREPKLGDEIAKFYDSWSVKELAAGRQPGKGFTVAVGVGALPNDTSLTAFWESIRRLQALGCKVIYHAGSSSFQSPETAQIVENFVAQNPNAIEFIFGTSQILAPALEKAAGRKIPVFSLDSWLVGPSVAVEVTCDNYELSNKVVRYLIDRLRIQGNVLELYSPGAHYGHDIRDAMWQLMRKNFPDIKQVAVVPTAGADLATRRDRVEAALLAHPKKGEIDAIYATSDLSGIAAYQAVANAGREDEVFVVSVDGDREAMRLIARGGGYAATGSQDFILMGATMAHAIVDYLNKKPVPRFIWTPSVLITKDNVYQVYKEKWGEDLKL